MNKWNKEAGEPGKFKADVVKEIPAKPGARKEAKEWEKNNAKKLREKGHLTDPTKHKTP